MKFLFQNKKDKINVSAELRELTVKNFRISVGHGIE